MSYLTTFISLIEEFIIKLSLLYPDDLDFVHFKTFLLILKKTNPRKILDMFNTHCLQYREYIKNKDNTFILTNDFLKDKREKFKDKDNDNDMDDYILNIMIKLRHYWSTMDEETIDNVWKYLNIFILLSDKLNTE